MRKLLCLAAITAASQVVAQESRFAADLQKTLEMPGHRSLQSVIEKPETTLSEFETDGCSGGMSISSPPSPRRRAASRLGRSVA